ncbi:MAG TPA: PAC2 family protein [Acidimicrobiales bacterium]|nr:PAC2 family protein [Acidimicrobiales bacterium]
MSPIEPSTLYEVHAERTLHQPVLVTALEGWVDAGLGSSSAVGALLTDYPTDTLVTFNSDHFLDQRARRPVARIENGITTELTWPETQLRVGSDRAGSDVLYLVGPEPDFHWRPFVDAVVGMSLAHGVRMAVGLGAFPAPAPHTRPVKLAATAPPSSAELVRRVGVVQGELEVPAGVQSALELGFDAVGIDAVTLWARVPHYVSGMLFPEASASLIDGLCAMSGLVLDSSGLHGAADGTRRQVDELINRNPEHLAMVRKLEESIDASEGNALGVDELPSGEEIAAELERFLRGEDQ